MPKRPPKNLTFEWKRDTFDVRRIQRNWAHKGDPHGTIRPNEKMCIAKLGNRGVAYVLFSMIKRADGSELHQVSNINIEPEHANKGIGTSLLHRGVTEYLRDNPNVGEIKAFITAPPATAESTRRAVMNFGGKFEEESIGVIRREDVPDEIEYD